MSKRPSIASLAPKKATAELQPREELPANEPSAARRPLGNEASYKSILSKVDEATHRQMKILAVNEGVPVGDLQIEAINLLFRSRGLPEIAERVTPDERGRR